MWTEERFTRGCECSSRRISSARRAADRRATSALAVVVPAALAASLAALIAGPQRTVIEFDDLRAGQLEAAGAVVLTLIGGVSLGRTRRDRSRRSLRDRPRAAGENGHRAVRLDRDPLAERAGPQHVRDVDHGRGLLLLAATLLPERATGSRSGTPRSTAPVPSTASTAARRGRARPCSWCRSLRSERDLQVHDRRAVDRLERADAHDRSATRARRR